MKHDKLSFFEVGRNMSKYLSCSLGLYLVFQGLVEVGDFVGLARVSSGPLLYGVSRITQSGVGHFLLMLLTTGVLVSIYECFRRGSDDNVVIDSTAILENCKNNVVKLPKDKLAVLNGLEGFIVAEHDNVLLICKKGDTSGLMRKYVNEIQLKYGEEFI